MQESLMVEITVMQHKGVNGNVHHTGCTQRPLSGTLAALLLQRKFLLQFLPGRDGSCRQAVCVCTYVYVCTYIQYMHRYGCCTCMYIHTAVISLLFPFFHFSLATNFYYRRSLIEKRVWLYYESRSVRRNTRQALDPPWSIHILKGPTDNPQVPAILPARLDAVRSSYFRLAHENRVSIICRLKKA